jgi:hypothetical protein
VDVLKQRSRSMKVKRGFHRTLSIEWLFGAYRDDVYQVRPHHIGTRGEKLTRPTAGYGPAADR